MKIKNFTLLFCCLLTLNLAFGQKKTTNLTPTKVVQNTYLPTQNAQARFMEMDTITSPVLMDTCSGTVFNFLPSEGSGFIGGTNNFEDAEKAQRMVANSSNFTVTSVFAFFGAANIGGDGELTAKIYEVNSSTNGPGTLVGTSDPIKASDINLDPEIIVPTPFIFSTPPSVMGNEFFISIDISALYASQDTVGLLLTNVDCGSAEDAWELFGDGETWVSMSNPDLSWNLLSNFPMLAILDLDGISSTQELLGTDGTIRLHDAFPNPASSKLTVAYDLEMPATIQLEIYSINGKLLQQHNQARQVPGQYQVALPIAGLPEGVYLYGIVTDKGRLMNKFTIGR